MHLNVGIGILNWWPLIHSWAGQIRNQKKEYTDMNASLSIAKLENVVTERW